LKIFTIFFCLFIHVCFAPDTSSNSPAPNEASATNHVFEDLSIIVFSCDKYQELWAPFFELFFKQWPSLKTSNQQIPIYLVTNSKTYDDPRITMVNIKHEKSWSDNALTVLAAVKTKYVLIILEDYFFTRIDEKRLHEIFNFMKSEDVSYCQIGYNGTDIAIRKKAEVFPGVAEKDRYEPWRTSLYSCIWRTKDMTHIVRSGESIWEFEIAGTVRSQGLFGKFLTVFENQPVDYLNMVQQGYLNSQNTKQVEEMGVAIKRVKLELDSDHAFKLYFYYHIFNPAKEFIKNSINEGRNLIRTVVRKVIPSFDSN
jgi:hypothetical protein